MVSAESFLWAILALVFLMMVGTYGFGQSCPEDGIVDLTDSSEFVNTSGLLFPRNSTWLIDGRTFGCICDIKTCVPFCCPVEFSTNVNGCVADVFSIRGYRGSGKNDGDLFPISNHCDLEWMDLGSLPNDGYDSFDDVTSYISNRPYYPWDHYCLYRKPNSTHFMVIACDDEFLVHQLYVRRAIILIVCYVIMILSLLATCIVYSVIPELRNLQGRMVFNCLASYVTSRIMLLMIIIWNVLEIRPSEIVEIAAGTVHDFGEFACMMWLNVFIFDVWKKFRTIQSSGNIDNKKRQKEVLIRYSLYVWSTSAIRAAIILFLIELSPFDESKFWLVGVYLYGIPGTIIFISNTCFNVMTALKIKQWKRETAHMVDGMNKHYQENQKWFNLNLKLFIATGCPIIFLCATNFWYNDIFYLVANGIEALHCVFIFLMLVWKDDIKGSIRKLFPGMLHRLGCSRCRDSTSVMRIENGKKNYISCERSKY